MSCRAPTLLGTPVGMIGSMTAAQSERTWMGLFVEHRATLRGFFSRRGAHEEAEDMVQETYLRLLRAQLAQGEAIANPEAYLYTVATHLVHEQALRRRPLALPPDELERLSNTQNIVEPTEDVVGRAQRRAQLLAQVAGLSANTRAVLVMQYRDGLSYRQIAERLGVSPHMVKKHVVRGLSACRSALAAEGTDR